MEDTMRDNHYNGAASEAMFTARALRQGYDIAKPLIDHNGYDFLMKVDGEWKEVQVKTAGPRKRGSGTELQADLHTERCKKTYDLLAIVYIDEVWLIPYELIANQRYVMPANKFAEYKM
jgi:hypothetical protein